MRILEIATFSPEAAKIAEKSGAHRLEICSNYSIGGITPSKKELEAIHAFLTIPAVVMVRPRGGNFVYHTKEIAEMLNQIQWIKSMQFAGIVFGVLNDKNQIDLGILNELVSAADGLETTFHMAFDQLQDPFEGIAQLMEAKVTRILSSSWRNNGMEYTMELQNKCGSKITFMPGGGIRSSNVGNLLEAGFQEIHSAAITDTSELPDAAEIEAILKTMKNDE